MSRLFAQDLLHHKLEGYVMSDCSAGAGNGYDVVAFRRPRIDVATTTSATRRERVPPAAPGHPGYEE